MKNLIKIGILTLGSTAGMSAAWPAAAEEFDPLQGNAALSYADKTAIDKGTSVLTDMGKRILGYAADAYFPGLGAMLGLTNEDTSTQKILDAIAADGARTRSLILSFWDWARAQNAAGIHADYAAVVYDLTHWQTLPVGSRLTNRQELYDILDDCVAVLTTFQSAPDPTARIDYLHSYTILLNLTIAVEAELSELEILGDAWETSGGGTTPANWWLALSTAERASIEASIEVTKQDRIEALLLPGLQVSFQDQMSAMDAGSLPGGTPGRADFLAVRDRQFSPLSYATGADVQDGKPTWIYYVGRDPQGNCVNQRTYCKIYHIVQGSTGTSTGQRFYPDFEGKPQPFYSTAVEAYDAHKKLMLKDMIVRGYGPVRAFADTWWYTWGLGARERLWLDGELDAYVESADQMLDGSLALLTTYQTFEITSTQKSFLYGFAATRGLTSVQAISTAAYANPDFLSLPHVIANTNVTQFPWWAHFNSIRAWPVSNQQLTWQYRGLPIAKFVALL